MKVKLEFEIEFDPKDKKESFETLEDFSDDLESYIRHYIKDYCSKYGDLDEVFVKSELSEIIKEAEVEI